MSFLLRVQLPDRPGSLGSLALALGAVGADILSLDVVERGVGYAVDDLVVDVRSGSLPDTLITAAEALDGVRVDSIRPFAGMLDTHRELELIDQVATAPDDRLRCSSTVPRGCCGSAGARWSGSGRTARTAWSAAPVRPRPKPVTCRGCRSKKPTVLDEEADWVPQIWRDMGTKLAAAPLGHSGNVLVLGRPGGPDFRPSEVARLGYLTGIIATVLA